MTYHNLAVLIQRQAEKYGNRVALTYRDYTKNVWLPVTWQEFNNTVRSAANSLVEWGIKEQENIGIFSQNMPECFYSDFAVLGNRAVSIPLYATSSVAQTVYIVNDAAIRLLFVGEQFQYDVAIKAMAQCPTLTQLIIFDSTVVKEATDTTSLYFESFLKLDPAGKNESIVQDRSASVSPDDLANILYTSGTTGHPKGVTMRYSCYLEAFQIHDIRLPQTSKEDISMCFLPITHVFERTWSYYCFHKGVQVCVNLKPTDIQKTIKEIRPTLMCSVPRFWEKVYSGVKEKIEETKGIKKLLMTDAIRIGKIHNVDYIRVGKKPPLAVRLKYKFYDRTIYKLLKETLGLERGSFFPVAGAPFPDEVNVFIHSVGINILLGYGLTESTATVCFQEPVGYTVGSVGRIMPNVEVKIAADGEILLRGKIITQGYYKQDQANKESYQDGWFRTGDAGYLKGDELFLTERLKDLFKTSNGKYIAPQGIETRVSVDTYIDQIAIIAENRKFVSALIVPEYEHLKRYAHEQGITFTYVEELLVNPTISALYKQRIDSILSDLASYEQIKRFTLLPKPFTIESGELTNTLKMKRNVLAQNYAAQIEKMYAE